MTPVDFAFLEQFPNGLSDERWIAGAKKHNPQRVMALIHGSLDKKSMALRMKEKKYQEICDIALQVVKKATIVSVFEKLAFQNYIAYKDVHQQFCEALFAYLHAFNEENFERFVAVLSLHQADKRANAAKWPLVTCFIAYNDPDAYICVKPNTVKAISAYLKVDIAYQSRPNYTTYKNVEAMVKQYRNTSGICKHENLMITQAVLFCVLNK